MSLLFILVKKWFMVSFHHSFLLLFSLSIFKLVTILSQNLQLYPIISFLMVCTYFLSSSWPLFFSILYFCISESLGIGGKLSGVIKFMLLLISFLFC